jgi:hypothetical protein
VIIMDLTSVLRGIHESEIEVTLRSRGDLGWQLQLEIADGQVARGIVTSLDEAAAWFHENVLLHCPNSVYAQSVRGGIRRAIPNDDGVRRLDGT